MIDKANFNVADDFVEDNNNQVNLPYWKYPTFDLELLGDEEHDIMIK